MAKKRYRVVGESVVAGHQPGEEFSFDFDAIHEERLIAAGAIEVVKPAKGGKPSEEAKEEDE